MVYPTDIIKAVNYAGNVDKLFDSFIFDFVPNLVTFAFAIFSLFVRYGLFIIIIMMYITIFYYITKKRSLVVFIRERDKYITVKDNQERQHQDDVRG